jgi:hypothetical protein
VKYLALAWIIVSVFLAGKLQHESIIVEIYIYFNYGIYNWGFRDCGIERLRDCGIVELWN